MNEYAASRIVQYNMYGTSTSRRYPYNGYREEKSNYFRGATKMNLYPYGVPYKTLLLIQRAIVL